MEQSTVKNTHNISISDRNRMELTGVEDVISFDEENVVMRSVLGMLTVDGTDLHVIKLELDTKEVAIEGNINGLFYIDEKRADDKKNGRLKRLFR